MLVLNRSRDVSGLDDLEKREVMEAGWKFKLEKLALHNLSDVHHPNYSTQASAERVAPYSSPTKNLRAKDIYGRSGKGKSNEAGLQKSCAKSRFY